MAQPLAKLTSIGPVNTKSRRKEAGGKNVGVKPVRARIIPPIAD